MLFLRQQLQLHIGVTVEKKVLLNSRIYHLCHNVPMATIYPPSPIYSVLVFVKLACLYGIENPKYNLIVVVKT